MEIFIQIHFYTQGYFFIAVVIKKDFYRLTTDYGSPRL
jgi:hypothetical protein